MLIWRMAYQPGLTGFLISLDLKQAQQRLRIFCMKKFIIKTLWFLLPVLLLSAVMEICLRKIPNDYLLKRKYLDAHSNEIETLILGTSHNFYGLNPVYFRQKTFNAAYLTQSLDYDYEIIKKYQKDFRHLKTIVLDISYFSLYSRLETSFWIKNYVLYYGMYHTAGSLTHYFEILSNSGHSNYIRFYQYYLKHNINLHSSALGWGDDYTYARHRDLVITGKKAAETHARDIYSERSKANFETNRNILDSIVNWAMQRNVAVILVTAPAFKSYRDALDTAQWNTTLKAAEQLAAAYSNCRYYNLSGDTAFEANDFFDADHLNETGAKKFSVMIDEKIQAFSK